MCHHLISFGETAPLIYEVAQVVDGGQLQEPVAFVLTPVGAVSEVLGYKRVLPSIHRAGV